MEYYLKGYHLLSKFDKKIFALLIIPPIIGILLVVFKFIEINNNITNTTQTASFSKIEYISQLIHNLQLERGTTARVITATDDEFRRTILEQMFTTDESIKHILQYDLNNQLNSIVADLALIRDLAKSSSLSIEEMFIRYNKIINTLLEYYLSIMYQSEVPHIKNELWNHYILMVAKENLGQLRAKITIILKNPIQKQNLMVSSIGNFEILQSNINNFKHISSSQTKAIFENNFDYKIYEHIKDTTTKIIHKQNNQDINPNSWFEDCSLLIDYLRKIEKQNLNHIESLMDEYAQSLYSSIIFWSLLVLIGTILLAFIYTLLLRDKLQCQIKKDMEYEKLLLEKSKMEAMNDTLVLISHHWRQPLSLISVQASSAKLKKELGNMDEKELYEVFDNIIEQTQNLSKILDNFRNLFKPDSKPEYFDIKKCITRVTRTFKDSLNTNKISLNLDLESIHTNNYESQLYQVISYILQNSIESICKTNPIEKFISIYLKQDTNVATITIIDSGGGIPQEIQKNIFNPYFTTKHQSQGTGLSLYIAYEIITKYINGTILYKNIKKNQETNACFEITLPITHKES